jgi:elongation factor P--(R)-beta-lysine ligase
MTHEATDDWKPCASLAALQERAKLLRNLREFFWNRGFIEVETPLLSSEVIPELHIEPIRTDTGEFLQASPELHMKRLLAAGAEAIFQVTRSFRAGERGRLHNPEFTIVEWYRVGDNMSAGMALLDELMQCIVATPPAKQTSYQDAFQQHAGVCPHTATLGELAAACPNADGSTVNRDELLNLLLATRVEPHLGVEKPEIIFHYPASQASLARTAVSAHGCGVAERFELYYRGVELANGFCELTDAAVLRKRLEDANASRVADGRPALPLPEKLLAAMEHGMPVSAGCALGFDRLAMLAAGATSIREVMAFSENDAES